LKKLAIALLFCSVSAFAATVTYTTIGAFGNQTLAATNSITIGTAMLTFDGISSLMTVFTPSNTGIGSMVLTDSSPITSSFSTTFIMDIIQSSPTGSGSTTTAVTGDITSNSSTITLTFLPSTLNISGITWMFPAAALNQPNGSSATTSLTASVATAVPEPATFGLLGASLAGLGIFLRRKR
jgi:hypothetical protein